LDGNQKWIGSVAFAKFKITVKVGGSDQWQARVAVVAKFIFLAEGCIVCLATSLDSCLDKDPPGTPWLRTALGANPFFVSL
jgi:hypothetical protein